MVTHFEKNRLGRIHAHRDSVWRRGWLVVGLNVYSVGCHGLSYPIVMVLSLGFSMQCVAKCGLDSKDRAVYPATNLSPR